MKSLSMSRILVARAATTTTPGEGLVCVQSTRIMLLVLGLSVIGPLSNGAYAQATAPAAAPAGDLPGPDPIPTVSLGSVLRTVPVRQTAQVFNWHKVDTAVLPRDRQGIWVLDFSFLPVRIHTIDIAGKGRRKVFYMYYKVVNRTGKPQMFVPQFTLVTDTGKRYEEAVLPEAVKVIQNREDPLIPLLGAVDVVGMLPPSTKDGVDDAVFGVAMWEGIDPNANAFSVFVKGLSDGHQVVKPVQEGSQPVIKYKTVRIDFVRRGDKHNVNEKQVELLDPPFEWIYW
jgi:hypothetical protein